MDLESQVRESVFHHGGEVQKPAAKELKTL
jgi:hypothetical protein